MNMKYKIYRSHLYYLPKYSEINSVNHFGKFVIDFRIL